MDMRSPATGTPVQVTLVSQPACQLCDDAKAVLWRLGEDFLLSIAFVDLATADGERLAGSGGMVFPPGVFVDGELFSYGRLSERKLRRELARRIGGRG